MCAQFGQAHAAARSPDRNVLALPPHHRARIVYGRNRGSIHVQLLIAIVSLFARHNGRR